MIVLMTACHQNNAWVEESDKLVSQAMLLDAKHLRLNIRIDSLWDVTSAELDKELPTDFPPVDRDIFLKARNADHIRMFMTFKDISPELQALVDKAGAYDQVLAQEMRELQAEQQVFEQRKNVFLQKVAMQNKATADAYALKFRTATAATFQ